jgi:hypothetical protein
MATELSSPMPSSSVRDPFSDLPSVEKNRLIGDYLSYLRRRDGVGNHATRTLSNREAFFQDLDQKPVRWKGPLDREAFYRNLDRKPEAGLDPKVVWLLAAAKANIGERFGVETKMATRGFNFTGDDPTAYVAFEELYHTRILLDACNIFDLKFEMREPKGLQRALTSAMARLPTGGALPMVLCGELYGSVCFKVMWETTDLFSEQPEVRERLRTLVREIWVDEIGHVAYARARLGPVRLGMARAMFPIMTRSLMEQLPEFSLLAGGTDKLLERVARFDFDPEGDARPHVFELALA